MEAQTSKPFIVRVRIRWPQLYDMVMLFVYLVAVHAWSLALYPLGRDYAFLESMGAGQSLGVAQVSRWMIATFGATSLWYHVVNLVLMYACMLCLYFLVIRVAKTPAWMGALAAALFMADPVHVESMFNLCGVVDLLPCLAALAALLAYAVHLERKGAASFAVAMVALVAAGRLYPSNTFLFTVPLLMEFFVADDGKARRICRAGLAVLGGVWAVGYQWQTLRGLPFGLEAIVEPLFLVIYPIGLLPETARLYHEWPLLLAGALAFTVTLLGLLCWGVRHRALTVGVLGMVGVWAFGASRSVDPVQMVGGGQLLLPTALAALAFVGLVARMIENRKWRGTIVYLTTVLCIVFFVMRIAETSNWRTAGNLVQAFQRSAVSEATQSANPVAVVPDYQYYHGAPVCLSESIRHSTPFQSKVTPALAVPMHYEKPKEMTVTVDRTDNKTCVVRVMGRPALGMLPAPYTLESYRKGVTYENARITVTEETPNGFTLTVESLVGDIPSWIIPGSTREESGQ